MLNKKLTFNLPYSWISYFREQAQEIAYDWDCATEDLMELESASVRETGFLDWALVLVKLLAYIVTFIIVLFCGTLSKLLALLMISNVKPITLSWCRDNADGELYPLFR